METGITEELFSQEPYALTHLLTPSPRQEDKNSSTETACLAVPTLYWGYTSVATTEVLLLCTSEQVLLLPVPNTEGQKYKS